jgi:hypothetical protein
MRLGVLSIKMTFRVRVRTGASGAASTVSRGWRAHDCHDLVGASSWESIQPLAGG